MSKLEGISSETQQPKPRLIFSFRKPNIGEPFAEYSKAKNEMEKSFFKKNISIAINKASDSLYGDLEIKKLSISKENFNNELRALSTEISNILLDNQIFIIRNGKLVLHITNSNFEQLYNRLFPKALNFLKKNVSLIQSTKLSIIGSQFNNFSKLQGKLNTNERKRVIGTYMFLFLTNIADSMKNIGIIFDPKDIYTTIDQQSARVLNITD